MSIFLSIPDNEKLYKGKHFFIIKDRFPVSLGHCLIISNKLKPTYFDLSEEERIELIALTTIAKDLIEQEFKPDGYNIGMNCGLAAGQTVMHFHCHIIPRYFGDMEEPSGGIRHCIKGKGYY